MTRSIAFAAVLASAGCLHAGAESEEPSAPVPSPSETVESGDATVVEEREAVPALYVAGDTLFGLPGGEDVEELAGAANATLFGLFSPVAVLVGDGKSLVYNSFRGESPVIRLRDLEADEDAILVRGALSLAWRDDGTLAYFKGLRPRVGNPRRYRGHVVVRPSPSALGRRWTPEPARYIVAAWAGDHLLVYRLEGGRLDLLALDGREEVRILAESAFLVALSPDGRRALVAEQASSTVRIVEIASGRAVAEHAFGSDPVPGAGAAVEWVGPAGSWESDLVVAPASIGLVVLRIEGEDVSLEQALHFPVEDFPVGVHEPRLGRAGRTITTWAELTPRPRQPIAPAAVLECDRTTRECVRGPLGPSLPAFRLVYNPSRP